MTTTTRATGAGSVPPGYRHGPKLATPGEPLEAGGAIFKWYDVHRDDLRVTGEVRAEARAFLEAGAAQLGFADELGFAILHRCGETFHFLLVSTWRGANELWETVLVKDGAGFGPGPPDRPHRPTFCVWELGVVVHERAAWTRFLESTRDAGDVATYVADRFGGPV